MSDPDRSGPIRRAEWISREAIRSPLYECEAFIGGRITHEILGRTEAVIRAQPDHSNRISRAETEDPS
jgi:hypothetical protein